MKRIPMLMLAGWLAASVAFAQEQAVVQLWRVQLDGGTVLTGTLTDRAESGEVVLVLPEGIEVAIPSDRIRRMETDAARWRLLPSGKRILAKGPMWTTGLHLLGGTTASANGVGGEPTAGLGFSVARLYQYPSGLQLGGGVQLNLLDNVFLPVFAEAGWQRPAGKSVALYASLRAGYGLPIAEYFDGNDGYTYLGGAFVQPVVGLRFAQRWYKGLQLEAGTMWQYSEGHIDWWWENSVDHIWYRRLALALKWSF